MERCRRRRGQTFSRDEQAYVSDATLGRDRGTARLRTLKFGDNERPCSPVCDAIWMGTGERTRWQHSREVLANLIAGGDARLRLKRESRVSLSDVFSWPGSCEVAPSIPNFRSPRCKPNSVLRLDQALLSTAKGCEKDYCCCIRSCLRKERRIWLSTGQRRHR